MAYPDAEQLLVAWYATTDLTGRPCSELPAELISNLPVARFERLGGADRDRSLDDAVVVVDCFAASRQAVSQFARDLQAALLDAAGYQSANAVISKVTTITAPHWAPYDNSNVRRYSAAYQVTIHAGL